MCVKQGISHSAQNEPSHVLLPPVNKVCGGYVFTPVSHSVGEGGLSQCMLVYPPGSRHPSPPGAAPWDQASPGVYTTPGSRPPWEDQTPPGSRPSRRTRHTSRAYTTPWEDQTPPWEQTFQEDQAPPRADTPRSACWEIRSTSGRYASYWNAILYMKQVILYSV